MSIGIFIFLIYVVAVVQMHYRGKVRFSPARQALTHTNYLAPYNLMMDMFSSLPNKPILQVSDIDELKILRNNWQVMRDEAMSLAARGEIKKSDKLNDAGFNSFFHFRADKCNFMEPKESNDNKSRKTNKNCVDGKQIKCS